MNYIYEFPDFIDAYSDVKIVHPNNKSYVVGAYIDDKDFLCTDEVMSSIQADLIDLASAVYIADWFSGKQQSVKKTILIRLPLRNAVIFNQSKIQNELQNLLNTYTGDHWSFQIYQRNCPGRLAETCGRQLQLFDEKSEVALWSGGLDSFAGLYGRISDKTANHYTLLGTGSNTQIQGKQTGLAQAIQRAGKISVKSIQIPIHCRYQGIRTPTNPVFRARGFVFKLIGAVCAMLARQTRLFIYENGYGAINLPFRRSEVGLAHTRSVHPISLIKTGEFISHVVEAEFTYENPYLFSTKTQMCNAIGEHAKLAFDTITCDRRYRQADQPSQCGYCSSCLLRRIAFINVFGYDHTEYVATHGSLPRRRKDYEHFWAMKEQVVKLREILDSTEPWQDMSQRYSELPRIVRQMSRVYSIERSAVEKQLLQMYHNHVHEWEYAEPHLMQ